MSAVLVIYKEKLWEDDETKVLRQKFLKISAAIGVKNVVKNIYGPWCIL